MAEKADLEIWSDWNNIRINGFHESTEVPQLTNLLSDLLVEQLGEQTLKPYLELDWAHKTLAPSRKMDWDYSWYLQITLQSRDQK